MRVGEARETSYSVCLTVSFKKQNKNNQLKRKHLLVHTIWGKKLVKICGLYTQGQKKQIK